MEPCSVRAIARFLIKRVRELPLGLVRDPRQRRDRRCSAKRAVVHVLVGLMSGCRGLGELEVFSAQLGGALRVKLKLGGRLPDTTARDWMARLDFPQVRELLRAAVHRAVRRKALVSDVLPIAAVAMDGRSKTLTSWESPYVQRKHADGAPAPHGLLRVINTVLISHRARPCIDVSPIPAHTNEMGHFTTAFDALCEHFGRHFELVSYDAGANSAHNAAHVVAADKHYLLRMNNQERHMQQLVSELLQHKDPAAEQEFAESKRRHTTRRLRILSLNRDTLPKGSGRSELWPHARTVLAVDIERHHDGRTTRETHLYVSSLPKERLTPHQWLTLTRRHWAVETCHQHLDTALLDDTRPWVEADGNAALVITVLRHLAYTLLVLYRSVTQRSDRKRAQPLAHLIQWVRAAAIAAQHQHIAHHKAPLANTLV